MTRWLYFDCCAGMSGDMCAAALLDAGASVEAVERALNSLPVEGFKVEITRVLKSGLDVCDFNVKLSASFENHDHDMVYLHGEDEGGYVYEGSQGHEHHHAHHHEYDHGHPHNHEQAHYHAQSHDHELHYEYHHKHHHGHTYAHDQEHTHRSLADVCALIEVADMTPRAKKLATSIFTYLGKAEACAHGTTLEEVHFHEVGALDSIADIVAIAVAFDSLNIDEVVIGDLPCGTGTVRCEHGIIPVPAPATLAIARMAHLPLKQVTIEGELVTPTGAAVAAALRTANALPARYTIEAAGMGAGKRSYKTSGILRALILEPLEGEH